MKQEATQEKGMYINTHTERKRERERNTIARFTRKKIHIHTH
jgi:hypothetical protein